MVEKAFADLGTPTMVTSHGHITKACVYATSPLRKLRSIPSPRWRTGPIDGNQSLALPARHVHQAGPVYGAVTSGASKVSSTDLLGECNAELQAYPITLRGVE